MHIEFVLKDKSLNAKTRTEMLVSGLCGNDISVTDLLSVMKKSKDSDKATCLEALEHFTLKQPAGIDDIMFAYVISCLSAVAPRVKWESARVIANSAAFHIHKLEEALPPLIVNAEHPGTVVRWSAAKALCAIAQAGSGINEYLLPLLASLLRNEEKNSIRKIYELALKKQK